MQCVVVVILWFCVTALNPPRLRKKKRTSAEIEEQQAQSHPVPPLGTDTKEKHAHRHNFASVLVQFHRTQCYFSATVQIASLTYGIFSTDMLNVFLLVPLATNGILPIVFTYILLLRYHRATLDITILTTVCWILASLVYWVLYSHVIPINGEIRNQNANYSAYEQFMYKLSALEACGGYSALAVCPDNFSLGKDEIVRASWRLRALTPVIWSFSSICLIVALGEEVKRRRREWKYHTVEQGTEVKDESRHGTEPYHHKATSGHEHGTHSLFKNSVVYCTVTALFSACVGMQLSLLSVSLSLKMTNVHNWTFGQIVAITVWTPPLLGYLYDEVKVFMPERFKTSTDELD
ncbi:hypothetical protein GMOD_00003729 [Pyrenophora seminiperda CCB06]|uniref:Integral membrane n=1 Tax=Pyrenophora seminiperda CCB06 TaxID=1302712 RepID=A0A3M7MJQ5_9PLEO|nr:hypothetical protein GMOD_00003729 [Pyrenophora seminiperda CCB06]